jgi:hypothetical protein
MILRVIDKKPEMVIGKKRKEGFLIDKTEIFEENIRNLFQDLMGSGFDLC